MKFIHAADLHLGASFQGIREYSPLVADALRNASYASFSRIIDIAVENRVDFILIAGDIFDSSHSPLRPQLKFVKEIQRLDNAGIPSYVVRGNHDPLGENEIAFKLPESCHVFSQKHPEAVVVKSRSGEPIASVTGMSYPKREFGENIIKKLKPTGDGALFSIALHHGNCGDPDHALYSPFTISDLKESPFDYWALGHIHKPQALLEARPAAIYAGSSQGLNPKETGERGCWIVEADSNRGVSFEFAATAPVVWKAETVDADNWETLSDAQAELERLCLKAGDEWRKRSVLLRIRISGQSALDEKLRESGARADLARQINEQIDPNSQTFVFIEQIDIDTSPLIDIEQIRDSETIEGEIIRLAETASEAGKEQEKLLKEIGDIFAKAKRAGIDLTAGRDISEIAIQNIRKARNAALAKLSRR